MTQHPVAFIDESYTKSPRHPGAYLLSAVLVDQNNLTTTLDAARQTADPAGYHTTRLYHRGHIGPIEDMLDTIEAHADWALLVAHLPLGPDSERSRQVTLSRLLLELNSQKVRDVVLDTRAPAAEQLTTQLQGRKVNPSDLPDLTTYKRLVRAGDISPRMRLMHVTQHQQPGLWMADALAWAAHRAMNYNEPQWFSRVTAITTIIDAGTGTHLVLQSSDTSTGLDPIRRTGSMC